MTDCRAFVISSWTSIPVMTGALTDTGTRHLELEPGFNFTIDEGRDDQRLVIKLGRCS
jgi:hypothetical protein